MKTTVFSRSFPVLLSTMLVAQSSFAARSPLLRYRFAEGQTNAYKIQIEIRDENGTNKLAGNIVIESAAVSSNAFRLNLRGLLSPRRSGPMRMPRFGGPYQDRFSMPVNLMPGGCEIVVSERGKVLRQSGDSPLPVPLGSVAQTLMETFPSGADSRWEISEGLAVLDDPVNAGPALSFMSSPGAGMPYYSYGQRGVAAVSVTRKIRYDLKSSTPEQAVITKHLLLESELQYENEPSLSAVGDGEFVFDRERGMIRQLDFQCKTTTASENVTRRSTVLLSVNLLEGSEREQAIQLPAGAYYSGSEESSSKPLTEAEIQQLAGDLKSNDRAARSKAASKLMGSDVSRAPHSLVAEIQSYLNDSDAGLRWAAAKVIGEAASSEDIPVLLKLLKSEDSSVRSSGIRGLGRLKDKGAAEPLAGLIARGGSDAYQAVEALGKIGPDAEDAVLPLFKERNLETRRQACNALKQVGTSKSLESLRDLILDPDQMLSSSATEAIRAISARQ